jgi:hypothetical protein
MDRLAYFASSSDKNKNKLYLELLNHWGQHIDQLLLEEAGKKLATSVVTPGREFYPLKCRL